MKKLLLSIATIGTIAFLSSCSKTTDVVNPGPSVSLSSNGGSFATGTTATFTYTATSGEDLKSIKFQKIVGTTTTTLQTEKTTDFDEKKKDVNNVSYVVNETSGTVTIRVTAIDSKASESFADFVIIVGEGTVTVSGINTSSPITLGNVANGSFGSFQQGTSPFATYVQSSSKANASNIDLVFGTGSTGGNEFFIGGATDASVAFTYDNSTDGVQNWSTKNATSFKTTTLSATQFDAITSDAELVAAVNAGSSTQDLTRVKGDAIAAGKVFAYTTASGKKGLGKIVSRNATSIGLVLKVQK